MCGRGCTAVARGHAHEHNKLVCVCVCVYVCIYVCVCALCSSGGSLRCAQAEGAKCLRMLVRVRHDWLTACFTAPRLFVRVWGTMTAVPVEQRGSNIA
jgi:hypothetical protein